MILNWTPLFTFLSNSPTSATFHNLILSMDALGVAELDKRPKAFTQNETHEARWRPSGNATTHETTPELAGFLRTLRCRGVLLFDPNFRTSQISTVPFLRPA